jgi:hypothetical protein
MEFLNMNWDLTPTPDLKLSEVNFRLRAPYFSHLQMVGGIRDGWNFNSLNCKGVITILLRKYVQITKAIMRISKSIVKLELNLKR